MLHKNSFGHSKKRCSVPVDHDDGKQLKLNQNKMDMMVAGDLCCLGDVCSFITSQPSLGLWVLLRDMFSSNTEFKIFRATGGLWNFFPI